MSNKKHRIQLIRANLKEDQNNLKLKEISTFIFKLYLETKTSKTRLSWKWDKKENIVLRSKFF